MLTQKLKVGQTLNNYDFASPKSSGPVLVQSHPEMPFFKPKIKADEELAAIIPGVEGDKVILTPKPAEEEKIEKTEQPAEEEIVFSDKHSLSDYIIGKQIGQGAYAVVRIGMHKKLNKKVALKIYEKEKIKDI